ncbi:MAG: hypothetical protein NZZ60_07005 [Bacteroidia bacterium]|nr:hypothetical protein [Bacteroidia bacterium]
MKYQRLSETAIWQIIRVLSISEKRKLRELIRGTRLEWLMDTLLDMAKYSEDQLHRAYLKAFPQANPNLIRRYKRELLDIIEEIVSTRESWEVGQEVKILQRFWFSVVLWQRGLSEHAHILWHQAMQSAVDIGWYEIALWGNTLLELYARDLHKIAPGEAASKWTQNILYLLRERYEALSYKLSATEAYTASRSPDGWIFPHLPSKDKWADYLRAYGGLQFAMLSDDMESAIDQVIEMIDIITSEIDFLDTYKRFHLYAALCNLGVVLINLKDTSLYNEWYHIWTKFRLSGYLPESLLYQKIHIIVISAHFTYLISTMRYMEAYSYYNQYRNDIDAIFSSKSYISQKFCVTVAVQIYLTHILYCSREERRRFIPWRRRVEQWIDEENFRDEQYIWWNFMRWYEYFTDKDHGLMRYWARKLRIVWATYFPKQTHWILIIRFVHALTYRLPITQRRQAEALMRRWIELPEEREIWEKSAVLFPIIPFVQSFVQKRPLVDLLTPVPTRPSPPDRAAKVKRILYKVDALSSCQR